MVKKRKTRDALEDPMMPHTGKGNVNTPKVKDSISSKKMIGLETLFFQDCEKYWCGSPIKSVDVTSTTLQINDEEKSS